MPPASRAPVSPSIEGRLWGWSARALSTSSWVGEPEEAARERPAPAAIGLATILFTDIEGSTAMTQRLGDAKAREVMREHERITRECLRAHGGSEVKTMGDGFMASFGSAVKALECAIAVQRAFAEHSAGGEAIRVRIGLNAGEPIAEDDPDGRGDLFGTAVIRAARIAALAQGGEILVANVVRELAEGKGFLFGDRGEVALRGFDDPVRLFEVRWREERVMEPRIQYAKTSDGVSIAYWTLGEGHALVVTPDMHFRHLQWRCRRYAPGMSAWPRIRRSSLRRQGHRSLRTERAGLLARRHGLLGSGGRGRRTGT